MGHSAVGLANETVRRGSALAQGGDTDPIVPINTPPESRRAQYPVRLHIYRSGQLSILTEA